MGRLHLTNARELLRAQRLGSEAAEQSKLDFFVLLPFSGGFQGFWEVGFENNKGMHVFMSLTWRLPQIWGKNVGKFPFLLLLPL